MGYLGDRAFTDGQCRSAEHNHREALRGIAQKAHSLWRTFSHGFRGIANIKSRVNYIIHEGSPLLSRLPLRMRPISYHSGADPITGWRRHRGSIWRAETSLPLGRNNQVFFNGEMMDEARWPHNSDGDPLTPNGAVITSGGDWGLTCAMLPPGLAGLDTPNEWWYDQQAGH